jgi:hypothetical protein
MANAVLWTGKIHQIYGFACMIGILKLVLLLIVRGKRVRLASVWMVRVGIDGVILVGYGHAAGV